MHHNSLCGVSQDAVLLKERAIKMIVNILDCIYQPNLNKIKFLNFRIQIFCILFSFIVNLLEEKWHILFQSKMKS